MIFVDTDRFRPVAIGKDIPGDKDLYWVPSEEIPRKDKKGYELLIKSRVKDRVWWDRQRTRCIHGFTIPHAVDFDKGNAIFDDGVNMIVNRDGSRTIPHLGININADGDVWISGRHYFYMNFWKISGEDKGGGKKDYIHPWFTDLSFENWMIRRIAKIKQKDTAWFKSRQKGLSEEEAADAGYDMLFQANIQLAIVAEEDSYNTNTYNMVRNGVWNMYNTEFFKKIKLDNDKVFSTVRTKVELHNRTAAGNKQVLSGLNKLYKVQIEEIGIMEEGLPLGIAEFVKPSIKTRGTNRTGFIAYVGTSGIYKGGVMDIEKMLYNPNQHDIYSVPNTFDKDTEPDSMISNFIPAWKFRIIDKDGNSMKQESIADILHERSLKEIKERSIHIASEPIETKDMFDITAGGFFGEFIIHHCNAARNLIMSHRRLQKIEVGRLEWKNPQAPWEGVDWFEDPEHGEIIIAEHPKTYADGTIINGLYVGGVDSYDYDEALTSSSKLAHLIHKGYDITKGLDPNDIYDNFVAMYLDRPNPSEGGKYSAYDNSAKLTMYYAAPAMIEYSKILIFEHYINIGLESMLAERPDFVIANLVERSEVSNKYGFPGSLVLGGLTKLAAWLKIIDHIYNCPLADVLKAWARFRRGKNFNCDITMATMLCAVKLEETISRQAYEKDKPQTFKQPEFKGYVENEFGVIVEQYG